MTNIDATLEQQIIHLPRRKRITNIHQHRESDNLGRPVELTERILRRRMLMKAFAQLKPVWSDSAISRSCVLSKYSMIDYMLVELNAVA